jgi:hypothetical protein
MIGKRVALTAALTGSFVYYVTFVQLGVLSELIGRFATLAMFGALGAAGCLVAGFGIDRLKPSQRALALVVAGCLAVEGLFGLLAARWVAAYPLLGGVLGLHIIALWVLFGRALGERDRAVVAAVSCGAIYLAANLIVARASGLGNVTFLGRACGGFALLAAVVLALSHIDGAPESVPSNFPTGTLIALVVLIALDSYGFQMIVNDLVRNRSDPAFLRSIPAEGIPMPWVANGVYHALAALPAGWLLLRRGRRDALLLSVAFFAAFIAAVRFSPRVYPHVILPLYGLFVAFYTVVFFTVWPSTWKPGREGRITALTMMVVGFGGSLGGIAIFGLIDSGLLHR